jgi:hypothetical protein
VRRRLSLLVSLVAFVGFVTLCGFTIVYGWGIDHVLVEQQTKDISFNFVGNGNAIACRWVMYGIGCGRG